MPELPIPLVSLVVRTKNEKERIERCLKSCLHQDYPSVELIVVDNESTDGTQTIAKKYTDLVFNRGPERIAQGNYGMLSIAKGKYVMYVDADMILEPGLISAAVSEAEKLGDIGLYINEVVLGRGFWGSMRRFERTFYNGTCIDAARFLRRAEVLQVGGFDEETFPSPSAEDWDLDRRMRDLGNLSTLVYYPLQKASWDQEVLTYVSSLLPSRPLSYQGLFHDEAHVTPGVYLRKKSYYSKTMLDYKQKWGLNDLIIKKQFGIKYRFFGVFLENKKWKPALTHPIMLLSIFAFRIAVGANYFFRNHQKQK
jgi:glycosyltransferase involved in cell wall biosynthesis